MDPKLAQPTLASLRKVLLRVLVERPQFDRLCGDYFGSLVQKISPQSSLDEALTVLFQYVEPKDIIKAIKDEADWAERFKQNKHLLTYPVSNDSYEEKNLSANFPGSAHHHGLQPRALIAFDSQTAVSSIGNPRTQEDPHYAHTSVASVTSVPFWAKRGLHLLLGTAVLGGSAGAALSFFHNGQHATSATPPAKPVAIQSAPPVPAILDIPVTTASASVIPSPVPPPKAPEVSREKPKLPKNQTPGPPKPPSSTKVRPDTLLTNSPPSCDTNPTGSLEHLDCLLKDGIAACRNIPASPATAQKIYDQLLLDQDRQQLMKTACDASKVELR